MAAVLFRSLTTLTTPIPGSTITTAWPNRYLRQHYWGGDIGGPVYFPAFGDGGPKIFNGKDTSIFYFSFERFVQNRAAVRNRNGVLTQNARNGMFRYNRSERMSDSPYPNCSNGFKRSIFDSGSVPFKTLNPLMTAHLAPDSASE